MKNWKNKINLFLIAAAAVFLLTGFSFGKSSVELRSEEPLIDLGSFVKDSPIGKEGSVSSQSSEAGAAETEQETEDAEEAGRQEQIETKPAYTGITVEITHDIITVNDQRCADPQEALTALKKIWRVGLTVYLVDDYAEYSTYKEMYRLLRENSIQVIEKCN